MTFASLSGWQFDTDADAGRTMRRMASNVHRALSASVYSPAVIKLANRIIAGATPRDTVAQVVAIRDWLDSRFRYVNDPLGVELLRDPISMFAEIKGQGFTQGDCDEAAVMAAILGMANGIPVRFRALAFYRPDAPFSHVVADLQTSTGWAPIDITKPVNMEVPPVATRTLIQAV